ncbi:hypothetical protein GCM10010313_20310 [Streptomyces violarus]|nr:hypothetical protein GCM10010313_20310 [Streptomyces violarus]
MSMDTEKCDDCGVRIYVYNGARRDLRGQKIYCDRCERGHRDGVKASDLEEKKEKK